MIVTEPRCKRMAVKSLKTGSLVVCCLLTLISKVSLSNANKSRIRKGETGRYMYHSDTLELDMYCRYCPNISILFQSEDVNRKYLVGSCVKKNTPMAMKLDQEELKNQLFPVCNEGEIPSCTRPQNPEGGVWKCEESENEDKVPVYKTCQLQCHFGYKEAGDDNIYCNESRKFDPPWTETKCINEHESTENPFQPRSASTRFPFVVVCVSVAVVLICVLVTIVYCCRKYPEQCENALSRIKRGFKKPKNTAVSSKIPEAIVVLEITDTGQSTSLIQDTQMTNSNVDVDPLKMPLLRQELNNAGNKNNPTENEEIHTDTDSSDCFDCIMNEIKIKKAQLKVFSDSEVSLDTSTFDFMTLNPISIRMKCQRSGGRPRPEGNSDFITGRNEPPTFSQGLATEAHPKEMRDSQETFSKEFMRDPTFCDGRVHRDLILVLEKHCANRFCEDVVKVVVEMEGLGNGHRSSQDKQRDHVYALMREKDLRIGHIVYYVSQNNRQDHVIVLHQIQQVHPDCNFCKSLYGDMDIH